MPTKEDAVYRDTDLVLRRERPKDEAKKEEAKYTYKTLYFFKIKAINLWVFKNVYKTLPDSLEATILSSGFF